MMEAQTSCGSRHSTSKGQRYFVVCLVDTLLVESERDGTSNVAIYPTSSNSASDATNYNYVFIQNILPKTLSNSPVSTRALFFFLSSSSGPLFFSLFGCCGRSPFCFLRFSRTRASSTFFRYSRCSDLDCESSTRSRAV